MRYLFTFFLLCTSFLSYSQAATDSVSIVRLLEKASTTFRSGDAKGYADCWMVKPYSVVVLSTDSGKAFTIPAEEMVKPSNIMGKGGSAEMSNIKMGLYRDNAWVSFDEVSTAKDGKKSYSYEIWMTEKIKGKWKLVAASMHFYDKQ
jgi:hypothetical protein